MEPPPYHHHHSRYVPLPSPTPPSFSTDHRNFYLPPPPLPPPPGPPRPLPQPYLPPPPPPRQSDFTFLSHRRSPPPRVFDHRSSFNHDHRPHLRIPQQITTNPFLNPESRVSLDFDRDSPNHHHRLFNNQIPLSSHYRTTSDNNYRRALDDGRFIRSTASAAADDTNDDFIDGFKNYHTNEEFLHCRRGSDSDNNKYYRSSQDRYGMKNSSGSFSFDDEFKFNGSKRDFGGSNLGNFVPFRDSMLDSDRFLNNRDENRRWVVQGRSSSRELYDPSAESENYEYGDGDGDGDGVRDGSLRRVSNIYDSDRVNYESSREGNQEFVHSPRKQVQKKSALLRIQFGNKHHNRNRNEQRFPAARSENSNYPSSTSSSGTFRNKGPLANSNNRMEEERERSPVELDVSFKSNALVAKAIVVSSGLEIESDRNITPRDGKITKITEPERDFIHSPPTKLNEGHLKSESSGYTLESPSISHKDSKQSGGNVMDSKGGAQPSTIGTIDSPGNNTLIEPVSIKGGNAVDSDGTSPLRIRKKKKAISPLSCASRSQQVKNYVEPVKTERPRNCPPAASQPDEDDMHSEEKTPYSSMVLEHNFDLQPSPNEVTALLEHSKVDKSPGAIVSEKDCTDIDSGNRNHSTSLLGSSTPVEAKIAEGTVITDRSVDFHDNLNPDNCPGEPLVSLQNGSVKGSPEAKLSLGGSVDTDLSSPGGIKMCEGPANLYSSFYDLQNASCSEDRLIKDQLKHTDSVIDAVDTGSEFNQATVLLESTAVERFPRAIFSVESNAIVGSSNAEETKMHDGVFDANDSTHYETTTSGYDKVLTNSQWKIPVSKISSFVDNNNVSCPHDTILFLENDPMEEPPEARMSVGGNLHVGFSEGCTPKKRKDRDEQSGLSSPSTSDICVNAVNIVHDTALSFPVNNFNSEEEEEEEVMRSGAGSQPCTYKDSIVHENSSTEGSSDNQLSVKGCSSGCQNGTYPKYVKKRKAFAPISCSPMLSETWLGPVSAGSFTFNVKLPSDSMMQSEDRVVMSKIDTLCSAQLPPCIEPTIALLGNTEPGATFDTMVLVGEDSTGSVAKLEQESPCPAGLGSEQKEKGCSVNTTKNHQIDILDMERGSSREIVAASKTAEEHRMPLIETDQHRNLVETQAHNTDLRQPVTDMECDSSLLVKDNLSSDLNCLPSCADANCISTANLLDETMEYVPDKLLNTGSPESLTVTSSLDQILNEKDGEDVRKQDEMPAFEGSSLYTLNAPFQKITGYKKSGLAVASVHSINSNPGPRDASKTTNSLNFMSRGLNLGKNQPNSTVPRVFRGHSSLNKTMLPSHIAKPRTWHRTGDPSASSLPGKNSRPYPIPPQGQTPRKIGKVQSVSYVRKGNSLVRKPSPAAAAAPNVSHALSSSVYQLNPNGIDEMKKNANVQSRVGVSNPPSSLRTELNASLERPKTPPLPCNTKLSNVTTISSGDYSSSPLADPPQNGCTVIESDCLKLKENIIIPSPSEDAPNSSGNHENQIDEINNFESQSVQDDGNSVSIETRKIVYVKRKSNQLVAASSSSDPSVQKVDKVESLSNDGYYKRRKNQLIRKSSEVLQNASLPDDCLNSVERRASQVTASSSSRRQSVKGLAKTYRPSKFSLVWNLHDAESLKKENKVLRQVWPHLFPWKRVLYKRSFAHRSVSISNYNSVSTISRKLLFSRKRETIYTRSTRGFSLRKSKVLSVGGSSLKWSKSIERSSKKANEEATLAVAAAEKKKREQNGAIAVTAGTKNRNPSSRERIFRIGSVRYKMDPTRRTLQRISDEKFPCSAVLQSAKDVKTSSVPKRLLIGDDEYVRIGNGNQLIRDPKKRTRTLASEKVRWSLYTARLRLAKKRTYCQFFTRFGKCNKGDGKCPYIHDPSKIAVCTKFLKGSCSGPYCKLTHKVIPERMQDCSYFLQGLCSNESCPYRHVNVNPNASTCEGFLRGYCADGNECPKKHSYICPVFEATGVCPQGSKCKLHHPKNRKKGKKRKQPSREEKNTRGRYFGCKHIDTSECRTAASEKHSANDDDDIFYEGGRLADYIHLDVSDEEARENKNPITEQSCDDGDQAYIPLDVDELIKPVSIMNKNLTVESSSAWNRFNEKTTGNISEESCCK